MALIKPNLTWSIELTSKEMMLVRKALREALREEDLDDAAQLGDLLATRQVGAVKHIANEYEKLRQNMSQDTSEVK